MTTIARPPCDEQYIAAVPATATCAQDAGKWVLAATILGSSMAFIDGTVVNVALPVLQQDLHATVAQVQWVVEAYSLFWPLLLTGGALGDRFGRRRIYATGVAIFAVASAWCGLAPDINQLIVARAVQGCGGACSCREAWRLSARLLMPSAAVVRSEPGRVFLDYNRNRAGAWGLARSIHFFARGILHQRANGGPRHPHTLSSGSGEPR